MSSRYGPSYSSRDSPLYSHSASSASSDRYGSNPYANPGYRSATPNKKGQYSASVLEELESQNDAQVEGLSAKVRMLKDITTAIGDEVRASTTLMESINHGFESTRRQLRGTMGRMLRMAERTGVGWKVWGAFFMAVVVLFWWVWI